MSLETQLLMKQLMKQYFLLLSGKRPMKANLNMDGHKIRFSDDAILEWNEDLWDLIVKNSLGKAEAGIGANWIDFVDKNSNLVGWVVVDATGSHSRFEHTVGKPLRFQSQAQICAELSGGLIDLPRVKEMTGQKAKLTVDLVVPTSAPVTPEVGSCYLNPATERIYFCTMVDPERWRYAQLQA